MQAGWTLPVEALPICKAQLASFNDHHHQQQQ
jgi:hypothetical protein